MALLQLHRDLGLFCDPLLLGLDLAGEFLDDLAACGLLPPVVLLLVVYDVLVLPLCVLHGYQVVGKQTILLMILLLVIVIMAQGGAATRRGLQGHMVVILVPREHVMQVARNCHA